MPSPPKRLWYHAVYLLPVRHAERPRAGLFFVTLPLNDGSPVRRAVVFVDGQNLFHAAREAFGYTYPSYDVQRHATLPLTGEEKGIDVRIALDVIALAHRREYDVALVMSQDQDLSEVAEEIRAVSREQQRWIKIASAFPQSPASQNRRGINKTDWIRIDRELYDQCLDRRDYRRKPLFQP